MNARVSKIGNVDGCGIRIVDADKVAAVRAVMPTEDDVLALSDVLNLLGDPPG